MSIARKRTGPNNARHALTMVEVTIVVAALTLLFSQAIPALRRARDTGEITACQDRLHQIARAGLVYAAQDANELAIPINEADAASDHLYPAFYGFGGKSGLGPTSDANTSYLGGGGNALLGAPHRLLNTVLFKHAIPDPPNRSGRLQTPDWNQDARRDLDVYHCPADAGFPGMHERGWRDSGLSSYEYYGTSYIANSVLVGQDNPGADLSSDSPYARPVSRIPFPSQTILYYENAGRFATLANNPEEHDQSRGCWPRPHGELTAHGWHGQDFHFMASFSDGHATYLKIKGYGWEERSPFDIWPCSTSTCDCIRVRGTGYRMDTLPGELLNTNKIRKDTSDSIFEVVPSAGEKASAPKQTSGTPCKTGGPRIAFEG